MTSLDRAGAGGEWESREGGDSSVSNASPGHPAGGEGWLSHPFAKKLRMDGARSILAWREAGLVAVFGFDEILGYIADEGYGALGDVHIAA